MSTSIEELRSSIHWYIGAVKQLADLDDLEDMVEFTAVITDEYMKVRSHTAKFGAWEHYGDNAVFETLRKREAELLLLVTFAKDQLENDDGR